MALLDVVRPRTLPFMSPGSCCMCGLPVRDHTKHLCVEKTKTLVSPKSPIKPIIENQVRPGVVNWVIMLQCHVQFSVLSSPRLRNTVFSLYLCTHRLQSSCIIKFITTPNIVHHTVSEWTNTKTTTTPQTLVLL